MGGKKKGGLIRPGWGFLRIRFGDFKTWAGKNLSLFIVQGHYQAAGLLKYQQMLSVLPFIPNPWSCLFCSPTRAGAKNAKDAEEQKQPAASHLCHTEGLPKWDQAGSQGEPSAPASQLPLTTRWGWGKQHIIWTSNLTKSQEIPASPAAAAAPCCWESTGKPKRGEDLPNKWLSTRSRDWENSPRKIYKCSYSARLLVFSYGKHGIWSVQCPAAEESQNPSYGVLTKLTKSKKCEPKNA